MRGIIPHMRIRSKIECAAQAKKSVLANRETSRVKHDFVNAGAREQGG
jgi:hypothetical protein